MPAPKDDVPSARPLTLGPSIIHFSKALSIIHKDRPLEPIEAETKTELDTFTKEFNELFTFDGGVLEENEVTAAPDDP